MKSKIIFTVGLNLIVAATAIMACPAIFVSLPNILLVAAICGLTICHILDAKGDIIRKTSEDYFTSALPPLPFLLGLIVTIFIPTDNIELKVFVLSACASGAWWGCCYSNYLYSTGDEDEIVTVKRVPKVHKDSKAITVNGNSVVRSVSSSRTGQHRLPGGRIDV